MLIVGARRFDFLAEKRLFKRTARRAFVAFCCFLLPYGAPRVLGHFAHKLPGAAVQLVRLVFPIACARCVQPLGAVCRHTKRAAALILGESRGYMLTKAICHNTHTLHVYARSLFALVP